MKTLLKNVTAIVITLFFTYNLSAQTATFYVTNINDSGVGSFRQAIANAAATTASSVYIYFSLPAGSTTITLQSEILTNYTGYTFKNIYIYGSTSSQIILNGIGSRSINCLRNTSYYYNFYIYSLQFQNFNLAISSVGNTTIGSTGVFGNIFVNNDRGVYLATVATVVGNYFGTNKSFSTGLGNYVGLEFIGGYNIQLSNNYICSNNYGIYAHNISTIYIKNNIIGTNNTSATRTDLGNVLVYYGFNGTESSVPYFYGNTIAYTTGDCLYVDTYSEIEKNDFVCNAARIVYNKSTPYPTPIITTYTPTQYGTATISGTASNLYGISDSIVLFYRDPTVCGTTPCQGKWLATVAANANKQWTANVNILPGYQITALANGYREQIIGAVESPGFADSYASLLTGCYTIPCPNVAVSFTAATNVLCYGGTDGAARLTITPNGYTYFDFNYKVINATTNAIVSSGTINPYTSQTLPTIVSNLSAGTYNVIISNPYNNCTYTSSNITIIQPNAPLSTTTCKELTPVSTTTSSDAVGQVVVAGGTSPYSLSVLRPTGAVINFPNQTSGIFNITGLSPGTYSITAYDAGYAKGVPNTGCKATCSFTINTPSCTSLKVSVNQTTNPFCYGGVGSLKIKCTDLFSNLPLTLSLSNGYSQTISSFSADSTVTVTNLPAANYTITLKNKLTCSVITTATISQPTAVLLTCDTGVVNAVRVGEASGSKRVYLSGGTTPYSLSLTGSEIRTITGITVSNAYYTIPNLKAGSYIVKITDANGCPSGNCSFIIKDPDCTGFSVTAKADSIRCFGENNGKITLTTVNSTTPITYLWSTNANTGNQSFAQNLGVGTYSTTITDDRYCKDTTIASISTPSVLTTSVSKTDAQTVGIANGKAIITVSGGTPAYNVNLTFNGASISPSTQTLTVFTFNSLAKGTYIALTTDSRGCSKWDTIRINDPSCSFQITGKADSVSCYNGNNGRITITPNSTQYPITYTWSQTGLSGNVASNLRTGAYSVTATTSQNCSDTLVVNVYQPDSLAVSAFPNDVTIVGGSNGSINVTINGGTQPYTVMLGTTTATRLSPTSFVFSNLSKGTYSFIVTDAKGCVRTQSAIIKDPDCSLMGLDKQVDSVKCKGGATGRITLVVNNTVGAVSYIWSPPSVSTGSVANNLVAGTYFATATDSRNCKANISVTVFEPTTLSSSSALTHVTLVNGSDGRIRVTVVGGTPPYSVRQDTVNAIAESTAVFSFNSLKSGTYTYTATDNNGCTISQIVTITEPICSLAIAKTVTNVSCNGQSNGSINNIITGGRPPLTILWSNGATTASLTNIGVGTYSIIVKDSVGCIKTDSMRVTEPNALTATSTIKNASTVGGNNGSINILIRGGTLQYTVVQGTPSVAATRLTDSTFVFNTLTKGTYTYTVTDSKGCTTSQTVSIVEPACTLVISTTAANVSCNGQSNGNSCIVTTGGVAPLTYRWSNGATTTCISNIPVGTYIVTVKDSVGCTKVDTTIITQPTVLGVNIASTNITRIGANNGTITLTASGGTPTYAVNMTLNGTVITPISQTPPQYNFTNLAIGKYFFTLTDAKGCVKTDSITITEPICRLVLPTPIVVNVSCNGGSTGSITANPTGGSGTLTYIWNPAQIGNSNIATALKAGLYRLTVSDTLGCIKTDSMRVSEPNVLTSTPTVTNVGTIGGNNGSINILIRGGTLQYTVVQGTPSVAATRLTDSTFVFNTLTKGTYTYTVTDSKGCTVSATVTVSDPSCTLEITTSVTNVSCNGQSNGVSCVVATGGTAPIIYKWSNGATTACLSNTPSGTYTVTVTDALGCIKTATTTVIQPPILTVNILSTNIQRVGANNGTITLVASGGTPTYAVNMTLNGGTIAPTSQAPPQYNFTNLAVGTYRFTITDAKGCTKTDSVLITEPTCRLQLSAPTIVNASCNSGSNGSITINSTGGSGALTYTWNPPQTTNTIIASNLKAGLYRVTVSDTLGCIKTDSMRVSEPVVLSATSTTTPTTTTVATDGTITVTVSGGTSPYTVRSGTLTATAQTATSFIFNGLASRDYIFTVTDSKGCTTTGTATVGSPNCNLSLQTQINAVKCKGESTGSILVTTTNTVGNVTFVWTPTTAGTNASALNLVAGTYTFTVTDGRNCSQSRTITVTEPPALDSRPSKTDVAQIGNSDGRISVVGIGGTPPYSVTIGTTIGTQIRPDSFVFMGLGRGSYTYILKDANGCTVSQTVSINDPSCATTTVDLTIAQQISCFGALDGRLNLTATNFVTPQYSWNPSSIGNVQNPNNLKAGLYIVTVSDVRGCSVIKQITLTEPLQIKATMFGDTNICQGQSTLLRFTVENATSFVITYTDGAQNFTTTSLITTVTPMANTIYSLVSIKSGDCTGLVTTNTVRINVTIPIGVTSIKAQKDSLCEGGTIILVPSPLANQYVWQRPNFADTVTTDALIIPNANSIHSGNYTVKARQSGCLSPASPLYKISVFAKPTERANAGVDKLECDGTTTTLNATAITSQNATGRWISVNSNVVLAQSANNITTATNLSVGFNTFVWVLSNAICGEVSRDSVVVSVSGKPELDVTPTINLDSKLTTVLVNTRELLKNKAIDPSVFTFKILNSPEKSRVEVRNNGIYFDRNDLIDPQTIEIEFEICSKICTTQCSKGKFRIVLQPLIDDTDFTVPKVFSLNNSNGSSLDIGGLDFFLDNEITIVNRWGSIVFGPTVYKNNTPDKSWNGTKNGQPLPTGAYYYYIRYRDNVALKTKRGILYLVEE